MLRTEWHATINCNSDELFLISRELLDRHVMAIKLNLNSKLEYIRINNFHHYHFKRQLKGSRNTKSRRRQELHALVNILLVFFSAEKRNAFGFFLCVTWCLIDCYESTLMLALGKCYKKCQIKKKVLGVCKMIHLYRIKEYDCT